MSSQSHRSSPNKSPVNLKCRTLYDAWKKEEVLKHVLTMLLTAAVPHWRCKAWLHGLRRIKFPHFPAELLLLQHSSQFWAFGVWSSRPSLSEESGVGEEGRKQRDARSKWEGGRQIPRAGNTAYARVSYNYVVPVNCLTCWAWWLCVPLPFCLTNYKQDLLVTCNSNKIKAS